MIPPSSEDLRAQWSRRYFGGAAWPTELDPMLEASPELLESYLRLSVQPWRHGTLRPLLRELVYVAVDSVPVQFYPPGLVLHRQAVAALGGTQEDIQAAIAIAGLVVMEGVIESFECLLAVSDEDPSDVARHLSEGSRHSFSTARGRWDPRLDALALHPSTAQAWIDTVVQTWSLPTSLSAADKELVLAASLSAAGASSVSLSFPLTQALNRGYSAQEVAEALALVSPLGMHAIAGALGVVNHGENHGENLGEVVNHDGIGTDPIPFRDEHFRPGGFGPGQPEF